jgi:ribosome-associated translation inhibitor RaiA
MQIQVSTDNHTVGNEDLQRQVEDVVESKLGRYGERITRVEVHLTDENGTHKSGDRDKRCVMEARVAGLKPITVSAEGSSLEQALSGAGEKLTKTLKRTLGKMDDPKGRTSFAGDQSP